MNRSSRGTTSDAQVDRTNSNDEASAKWEYDLPSAR